MAKKIDGSAAGGTEPPGPRKAAPAANPRLAEAQRRAQTMAKNRPTSPGQFFQEAWVELKKTTWPSKETTVKSTTVVLALVVAVAIWVGVLDALFTQISGPVFNAAAPPR